METLGLLEFGRILRLAVSAAVLSILVSTGIAGAGEFGTVSRIAGQGSPGFSKDGVSAKDCYLGRVTCIKFDSRGNLFFNDNPGGNSLIRKIDAVTGTISTVGGGGGTPFVNLASAQLPARSVFLSEVNFIGLDSNDNIYLTQSSQVSKISADGLISTIAGNGIQSTPNQDVDNVLAKKTRLWGQCYGIAVDSNSNIFYSSASARIRKVSNTGILNTTAGRTLAYGYNDGPFGNSLIQDVRNMEFDSQGNLYFLDYGNKCIRKLDKSGIVSTVLGGTKGWCGFEQCVNANIYNINAIAFDRDDNLYFGNSVFLGKLDTKAGIVSDVLNGCSGNAVLPKGQAITSMAIDSNNNLYVSSAYDIYKISSSQETPACPQSLAVISRLNGQNAVNVITWQPPANSSNVAGYKVYGNDAVLVADITETGSASYSCTDTNVMDCANYCYSVTAFNAQGNESANCASACVTTADATPPSVPQNLTANATGPAVTLSWNPAADTCEGGAAGYKIYSSNNVLVGTTSDTSYSVPVAEDGNEYCFYVKSFDSAGNTSMPSNEACATSALALTTSVDLSGKCGGSYNPGSAVPLSFKVTRNGLPVGPAEIGNPVPKLYHRSAGNSGEVTPTVIGSADGLFHYVGNGEWKIVLKMSQAGDYIVTAVPNPNGNTLAPRIVFNPAPVCSFTLIEKGKK